MPKAIALTGAYDNESMNDPSWIADLIEDLGREFPALLVTSIWHSEPMPKDQWVIKFQRPDKQNIAEQMRYSIRAYVRGWISCCTGARIKVESVKNLKN